MNWTVGSASSHSSCSLLWRQRQDTTTLVWPLINAAKIPLPRHCFYRITNMARQFVTVQQWGQRCAPEWDKIQIDSKSLAVAPGLRAPVVVTLLSCMGDEAPYWHWAEDVFEVMNSGSQTHNISRRILSCLVSSQGLLRRMKQIHLLSPEAKPFCSLHVLCFSSNANTVCTFSDLKILYAV